MPRVVGLDLLRAVAITMVLLQHFLDFVIGHAPWIWPLWGWGVMGVDLFFALSGFLIGRILLEERNDFSGYALRRFLVRRWLRTLPLYYVVLLGRAGLSLGLGEPPGDSAASVAPYLTFTQAWFSPLGSFFNESWSLAVEEWFYFLFPLIWLGAMRAGFRPGFAFTLSALALIAVSALSRLHLAPMEPAMWLKGVNSVTVFRFDGLGVGLLAAGLSGARPEIWLRWRRPALGVGVVLLVADWYVMSRTSVWTVDYIIVWHFWVVALGSGLLLPWASSVLSLPGQWLETAVQGVARLSYALYLAHGFFYVYLLVYLGNEIRASPVTAWVCVVAGLIASLMLAVILNRWIERPALQWRDRRFASRSRHAGAAVYPIDPVNRKGTYDPSPP